MHHSNDDSSLRGFLRRTSLVSKYLFLDRTLISQFVETAASAMPSGSTLIDAGAGEGMYKHLFGHVKYLAFDYGIGDQTWNYGALDTVCDLHSIPVKDRSVNYVLSTQTLEHVKRPAVVISEFCRVLLPGGTAFCTLPFQGDGHHQEPYDFFRYTKYAIEDMFRNAGFTDIEIKPIGGYNTLMVGLLQKGIIRMVEKQQHRNRTLFAFIVFLQKVAFFMTCMFNWFAWKRDQKDRDQYRFAMDFAVIARK